MTLRLGIHAACYRARIPDLELLGLLIRARLHAILSMIIPGVMGCKSGLLGFVVAGPYAILRAMYCIRLAFVSCLSILLHRAQTRGRSSAPSGGPVLLCILHEGGRSRQSAPAPRPAGHVLNRAYSQLMECESNLERLCWKAQLCFLTLVPAQRC